MNKYEVTLTNDRVRSINSDSFYIDHANRVLYFYRGGVIVACFDCWAYFVLCDVAEVPICGTVIRKPE